VSVTIVGIQRALINIYLFCSYLNNSTEIQNWKTNHQRAHKPAHLLYIPFYMCN